MAIDKTDDIYFSYLQKNRPEEFKARLRQLAEERDYFVQARAKVISTAMPTYIMKEGATSLEAVYPESVTKAIEQIDEMERLHFKDNKLIAWLSQRYEDKDPFEEYFKNHKVY